MERMQEMLDFDEVVVLSAKSGFNVDAFINAVASASRFVPPSSRPISARIFE